MQCPSHQNYTLYSFECSKWHKKRTNRMRLHIIGLVWYGNNNKNTNCRQPVIMLHINIHNISEWLLMTIRYQYSAAINFSTVAVSLLYTAVSKSLWALQKYQQSNKTNHILWVHRVFSLSLHTMRKDTKLSGFISNSINFCMNL